jgi:Zn-dependent peptidase ImmA (M78 family)
VRVAVKPDLLVWARKRARIEKEILNQKFPKLEEWERGSIQPTFKQLEKFANTTHAPMGYFFLPRPPTETLPIPDFRTISGREFNAPSPDLIDTIIACSQRQEWYKEQLKSQKEDGPSFVGSMTTDTPVREAAQVIRHELGMEIEERSGYPTWSDALRAFIEAADEAGIMVMCSGVVFNNNHRHLDPQEFRGFAMVDPLAPLIFINGADSKSAQMFTIAHELAHVWLGQSALSDSQASVLPDKAIERWCNQVAAEMLVPLSDLHAVLQENPALVGDISSLGRRYKVSTLVILRRLFDVGGLNRREFAEAYQLELDRIHELPKGSGGNFYLTEAARVSKRFARALIASALEGQTLYRDAFHLLGISKLETFSELGRVLKVI